MPICFNRGQVLGSGDLTIELSSVDNVPQDAFSISYTLSYIDPGPPETEVPIAPLDRTPVRSDIGEYYAAVQVPPSAPLGTYRIRWNFRQYASSPEDTAVQDFGIVQESTLLDDGLTAVQRECIRRFRILVRDLKPDRNYHFRPPEHEGTIKGHNQIFGHIWEDEEILVFIQTALDWWNMMPPETESLCSIDLLVQRKPVWKSAIMWGAIVQAALALAFNWVVDEFSYSIGGVSLDLSKSSSYESLKNNAESQLDKAVEAKSRTTKYIRGVCQPRYGIGVRSSFGPRLAGSALSPRNFIGL